MEEKRSVVARVVLNVAGKPKEHVEQSMRMVIENVQKEGGISILKRRVMKTQKKEGLYFSSVAELEIRCEESFILMGFCLDYLPSSVEVVEPEELHFNTADMTGLLNDMLSKLHNVNLNVGQIRAENTLLQQNGERLLKNIVMISIRGKAKTMGEIASDVGINAKELAPFVERFVKDGRIEKKKDKYKLKKDL